MDINKKCKLFIIQSVASVVVLNLIGAIVSGIWNFQLFIPLVVSTLFVLILDMALVLVWRWVALRHADMMPSFFTGVSGVRFFGSILVLFVWFVAASRESMLPFFVVFLVFYMVSLLHQTIFFSRITNRL